MFKHQRTASNDGMTASHYPSLGLHAAAASGDIASVAFALKHGQPINSVQSSLLPIHAAASCSSETSVVILQMLVDAGADINALRLPRRTSTDKVSKSVVTAGSSGSTALHFAAANGLISNVEFLLKNGADPTVKDENEVTPILLAVENEHWGVTNLIQSYLENIDAKSSVVSSSQSLQSLADAKSFNLPVITETVNSSSMSSDRNAENMSPTKSIFKGDFLSRKNRKPSISQSIHEDSQDPFYTSTSTPPKLSSKSSIASLFRRQKPINSPGSPVKAFSQTNLHALLSEKSEDKNMHSDGDTTLRPRAQSLLTKFSPPFEDSYGNNTTGHPLEPGSIKLMSPFEINHLHSNQRVVSEFETNEQNINHPKTIFLPTSNPQTLGAKNKRHSQSDTLTPTDSTSSNNFCLDGKSLLLNSPSKKNLTLRPRAYTFSNELTSTPNRTISQHIGRNDTKPTINQHAKSLSEVHAATVQLAALQASEMLSRPSSIQSLSSARDGSLSSPSLAEQLEQYGATLARERRLRKEVEMERRVSDTGLTHEIFGDQTTIKKKSQSNGMTRSQSEVADFTCKASTVNSNNQDYSIKPAPPIFTSNPFENLSLTSAENPDDQSIQSRAGKIGSNKFIQKVFKHF